MGQELEQACRHCKQVASAGKTWKAGGVFTPVLGAWIGLGKGSSEPGLPPGGPLHGLPRVLPQGRWVSPVLAWALRTSVPAVLGGAAWPLMPEPQNHTVSLSPYLLVQAVTSSPTFKEKGPCLSREECQRTGTHGVKLSRTYGDYVFWTLKAHHLTKDFGAASRGERQSKRWDLDIWTLGYFEGLRRQ